jgi:HD superfamily phosphodiesterase
MDKLRVPYTPPQIDGGHEFIHVERMIALAARISKILTFDMNEFRAAAWLHNLDRCPVFKPDIEQHGLRGVCLNILAESPFSEEARERIGDTVLEHNKKEDEPGDSTLLTALRIADKLDRFGPLGILAAAAHQGPRLLAYDPERPFLYDSTEEGKLKSIYNNLFRILEWVTMLPSDEARDLINPRRMRFYIAFLRELGAEIAEVTGKPNEVEVDIKKALGSFYEQWASS